MSIWFHNDIDSIVLAFKSGSQRALTVFVCKAFVMQIGEIAEKPPSFWKLLSYILPPGPNPAWLLVQTDLSQKKFFSEIPKGIGIKGTGQEKIVFLSSINLLLYEIWNYNRKVTGQRRKKRNNVRILTFSHTYLISDFAKKNVLM